MPTFCTNWQILRAAKKFTQPHIVGGGRRRYSTSLCADLRGISAHCRRSKPPPLAILVGIQLMTLDELNNVDNFRQVVSANYDLTTYIPNPDSTVFATLRSFNPNDRQRSFCA